MRFLLSRRWILFALAVSVLAYACVWLGEWQFGRLHDRQQRNETIARNLSAPPVPVTQLMAVGEPLPEDMEWRRVRVQGAYDAERTVVLRYQTRDGRSGVDLVTPLRTAAGPAVLVDRGWLPTENVGSVSAQDLPAPPTGTVTVQGWARANATGDATEVADGSTRAISSEAIGEGLAYPLLGGFVDAETETPAPATELVPAEQPDLGEGPHFFYGLQWWFFGLLALGGFGYLIWDERRRTRTTERRAEAQTPEGLPS